MWDCRVAAQTSVTCSLEQQHLSLGLPRTPGMAAAAHAPLAAVQIPPQQCRDACCQLYCHVLSLRPISNTHMIGSTPGVEVMLRSTMHQLSLMVRRTYAHTI